MLTFTKKSSNGIFYPVDRSPVNTQQMTVGDLFILPVESLIYLRVSQEASFNLSPHLSGPSLFYLCLRGRL